MGRLVVRPIGSEPPELQPGEQISSQTKLVIDDRKPAPEPVKRFNISVADAKEETAPPPPGYYNIDKLDVSVHESKLKPGETEKDSAITEWLLSELQNFHEAKGVVEDFKRQNPEKISAQEVNQTLLRLRGKGWGKWKDPKGTIDGLELTTSDMIDHQTLMASYVDHVTIHQWWLNYRKRLLKLCIRYAEDPKYTLEQFYLMKDQITQETVATVPKAEALTTQAKIMHKEAESRPDQISDLLNKTLAAKEALYAAMSDLGESVHKFKETTDAYSKDLHAFKASVIHDISTAKREMSDVRKFFLEKDHVTEIERLKEFIVLCERLRELKNDGTLDAIANTILKLEGA